MPPPPAPPALEAAGVEVRYPDGTAALAGVDLAVAAGETVALVGESGSGKSTVARCIVRLVEPTGGDVVIAGSSILGLQPSRLAGVYRHVQMVFQDPNASLNPRMRGR